MTLQPLVPAVAHVRAACALAATILLATASNAGAQALVDIATDASDPNNLADTEPSIAVNPANPLEIIVVTFSEGWGPAAAAPIWRSVDGGATWRKLFVLPQPNANSGGPGDQKIAFTAGGNLHVAELASGVQVPRCLIFRQTGAAGALLTAGTFYCDDQPHLDIDQSTGAFAGRAYSSWLDFSQANARSSVTRSTDGGANVTNTGVGSNASFPNRTTRTAVAPDGSVYVIYKTREGAVAGGLFENAHFRVQRSDDGGVNWNAIGATGTSVHGAGTVQTWFTTTFGNAAKGKVARARSSDAWIAVDPSDGDVYAAFCQNDSSGFGQVHVARSTDRGATWRTTRVTDGMHHSAYPEIAVAGTGAVGVLYVDFDDSGTATIFRHRFARSLNDGSSWNNETLQSMNPGPIQNAVSGFLWGDYEGLTARGDSFYGVFTGESIGRTTRQLDPIFFQRSAIRPTTLTVRKVLVHPDRNHLRLFNLWIDGVVIRANVNAGTTGPQTVNQGNHTVRETGGTGTTLGAFHTVIGGDCAANGTVSLAAGDSKMCTITNYDNFGGCPATRRCCEPGSGMLGCQLCVGPRQQCP